MPWDSRGERMRLLATAGMGGLLICGIGLLCFAGMVSAIVAMCLPHRPRIMATTALCMGVAAATFIAWQFL